MHFVHMGIGAGNNEAYTCVCVYVSLSLSLSSTATEPGAQADVSGLTKIEKNGKVFYHVKTPFTAQ